MSKPLKETFWARVYRLFHGMVFYNTIYWRRASDGLNPPRLSPAQRVQSRPARDLAVIKPRAKPRAKLESLENASPDPEVAQHQEPLPAVAPEGSYKPVPAQHPAPVKGRTVPPLSGAVARRKRRHYRLERAPGFLERWFG